MRRKTKTWIPLCIGLSLLGIPQAFAPTNGINGQTSNSSIQNQGTIDISRRGQLLQNLLQEHGLLLNQAILGALHNDPQPKIEATKQQLLNNAHQIAMLVSSHFGPQSGQQFEPLLDQHIALGAEYINAVKLNNQEQVGQVANKAMQNGRMIAQFLSNLFPSVNPQVWMQLLAQHVLLEAQQTQAYFMGNMAKGEELKNNSLAQLREIANTALSALRSQNEQAKQS